MKIIIKFNDMILILIKFLLHLKDIFDWLTEFYILLFISFI